MSAKKDLQNLGILVTRPEPQGMHLCEFIHAQGGKPYIFSVIEIVPLKNRNLNDLHQYDWLIFNSPQAVYQIPNELSPLLVRVKIAAIGLGTAKALNELNIPVAICPQKEWSSEGLLAESSFQNLQGKKIAILKGEGGRQILSEELTKRGAKVTSIALYRRVLPKASVLPFLELLRRNAIDVIICTSNEGMQNLKVLLAEGWDYLRLIPILVISQRMQNYAQELGFEKTILAENASHEVILKTLFKGIMYDK